MSILLFVCVYQSAQPDSVRPVPNVAEIIDAIDSLSSWKTRRVDFITHPKTGPEPHTHRIEGTIYQNATGQFLIDETIYDGDLPLYKSKVASDGQSVYSSRTEFDRKTSKTSSERVQFTTLPPGNLRLLDHLTLRFHGVHCSDWLRTKAAKVIGWVQVEKTQCLEVEGTTESSVEIGHTDAVSGAQFHQITMRLDPQTAYWPRVIEQRLPPGDKPLIIEYGDFKLTDGRWSPHFVQTWGADHTVTKVAYDLKLDVIDAENLRLRGEANEQMNSERFQPNRKASYSWSFADLLPIVVAVAASVAVGIGILLGLAWFRRRIHSRKPS